jgi:hypothetical protein
MVTLFARAVLAQLLLAEAFLASYAIALRLLAGTPTLLRWVGVAVCTALLFTVGFHVLAAFGAFDLLHASVALTVLAGAVVWYVPAEGLRRSLGRDVRFAGRVYRHCRNGQHRWVVLAFLVVSLPILLRPFVLPPLGWDTLTYHGVKAAMWMQHAGEQSMHGPGTWAYYATMWAGGEVFTSWAMLLFHGDLLAMEVDVVEWLALGLALTALARGIGVREPYASTAVVFAMAVPTLRISVGSGYVETALLMAAFSGLALAVSFLNRGSLGAFYLSIAAIAVAAGIKVPFVPVSLCILAIELARIVTLRLRTQTSALHIGAGVALFLSILAPWPLRAWRQTGLPLSPLPVELFGMKLGEPPPEVQWYMDRGSLTGASELGDLRQSLFQERMGPGATTMVAVGVSLLVWPLLWRRRAWPAALLCSTIAATWAAYYAPNLSLVRHEFASSGVRFLLPALLASVVLSVTFCARFPRLGRLYRLFLLGGAFFQLLLYLPYGMSASGVRALCGVFVGACGLVVSARVLWRLSLPGGARPIAFVALVATALLGLSVLRDRTRTELFRGEFTIHPIHPYWLEAATIVDQPEGARRIAVTSGPMQDLDNWIVYPFLGRTLQNEVLYVPIARDGVIHHFGGGHRNEDLARSGDFLSWSRRLRSGKITAVMSFRPASVELEWMESHPEQFRRLAGESGDWGLFAVVN